MRNNFNIIDTAYNQIYRQNEFLLVFIPLKTFFSCHDSNKFYQLIMGLSNEKQILNDLFQINI